MKTTIMENQMEKNMENEMETGIIMVYIRKGAQHALLKAPCTKIKGMLSGSIEQVFESVLSGKGKGASTCHEPSGWAPC